MEKSLNIYSSPKYGCLLTEELNDDEFITCIAYSHTHLRVEKYNFNCRHYNEKNITICSNDELRSWKKKGRFSKHGTFKKRGEMKQAFFIPFMDSVALKERTDQMKHIHMREWKTK